MRDGLLGFFLGGRGGRGRVLVCFSSPVMDGVFQDAVEQKKAGKEWSPFQAPEHAFRWRAMFAGEMNVPLFSYTNKTFSETVRWGEYEKEYAPVLTTDPGGLFLLDVLPTLLVRYKT